MDVSKIKSMDDLDKALMRNSQEQALTKMSIKSNLKSAGDFYSPVRLFRNITDDFVPKLDFRLLLLGFIRKIRDDMKKNEQTDLNHE